MKLLRYPFEKHTFRYGAYTAALLFISTLFLLSSNYRLDLATAGLQSVEADLSLLSRMNRDLKEYQVISGKYPYPSDSQITFNPLDYKALLTGKKVVGMNSYLRKLYRDTEYFYLQDFLLAEDSGDSKQKSVYISISGHKNVFAEDRK
ncbi:MAG: hypothetical protein OEZ43_07040 [Gammaproteobacteria bacterium]|nr:hypothetical protein [Gammaproteobacteria bacterium]